MEFDSAEECADTEAQLSALDGVLDYLYRIREYRRHHNVDGIAGYDASARANSSGRITEGVIMLRGKLTHYLMTRIEPRMSELYPGSNLFPGEGILIGMVLRWPAAGLVLREHPDLLHHAAWCFYESEVGQMPVRITLDAAQDFLLDNAILGPLNS
jgi:hypothetical protein